MATVSYKPAVPTTATANVSLLDTNDRLSELILEVRAQRLMLHLAHGVKDRPDDYIEMADSQ